MLNPNQLSAIQEAVPPEDLNALKERDRLYSDHNRHERVRNVINWIFVCFISIVSVVATGVISIRLAHLALPDKWHWLTNEQLQGIDKLFFSGAIGALIVSHFKKSQDS